MRLTASPTGSGRRSKGTVSIAVAVLIVLAAVCASSAVGRTADPDYPEPLADRDTTANWIRVTAGLPVGAEYYGVAFGDINNDGKLDVVAQRDQVKAFVGDGLGNFMEQSSGLVPTWTQTDVILADLNNDGNLDIVGDNVYFGNGGRGGTMSWRQTTSPGIPYSVTAADVNLDGKMDLVTGTASGVRVWTGNGGAGGNMVWTSSSTGLPGSGWYLGCGVGDLNRDGKPDLVCADNTFGVKAWTGNGGTGAAARWTDAYTGSGLPTTDSYMDVDLGDINHDGNLDIVATSYYWANGVRAWLGNGGAGGTMRFVENSNGLITSVDRFIGVTVQDVNDDGNMDIVAAHYLDLGLKLWLGDGGAGGTVDWTEASTGLPTGRYVGLDAGDFNNDGKIDILASCTSGVQVWQNERPDFAINSYVSASVNLPTANTWADVRFADVNRDGKLDIGFTSFRQDNGMRVFRGDGRGVWAASSTGLPTTGNFSGMRFADINHDGTLDIVAAKEGSPAADSGVHVWSGSGTGFWTEMSQAATQSGAGLELADVNNDGDLDVLTGYWANGWGPMVFLGNGDFGWGPDVGPASTMNVDDVAATDVNHDGKMDFAASSMNGVGVQLWTGDGSGTSGGWTRNDTGLPTTGVYLGLAFTDVNHDGHPDLAAAGYAGGVQGVFVWLGNGGVGGTMSWTPAGTGLPATGQYGGIEFGDTNLDGDADLISADSRSAGATGLVYRRGNGGAGGSMSWSAPAIAGIPSTGQHWGVAFGDVDNDGITDIAATSTAGVRVYTQGTPPNQPPTITIVQPAGSESWTGGSLHNIDWTASDPEDAVASLRVWANYSVTGGPPFDHQVAGLQGIPANARPFAWPVAPEDSASVVLEATVVDTRGGRGFARSGSFEIDSTAPTVSSTSPLSGEAGVPTTAVVQMTWSEPMNRASAEAAFSLKDTTAWTAVPGMFSWAGDTLAFTPSAPLAASTQYSANITTSAADDSQPGNNLASAYVWTFTTATVADRTPPTLMSVTALPDPQEVFLPVNVSAVVQDNVGVAQVWLNVTDPVGGSANSTMAYDSLSMRYFLERSYGILGTHAFVVWAADTSGNWNSTSGPFVVRDTTSPAISGPSAVPDPVDVPSQTNLTAVVTDNYLLAGVRVEVTAPDSSVTNQSMFGGPAFYFPYAAVQVGTHTFVVSAVDSSGNWASRAGAFLALAQVPPTIRHAPRASWPVATPLDLVANVTDDLLVQSVRLNFTDVDGIVRNVTMSRGVLDEYTYRVAAQPHTGTLSYFIWANDSRGNAARSPIYTTAIVERRPNPPTGLAVTPEGFGALLLQWTPPTTNDDGSALADLRGYNVYRMTQSGGQRTRVNTAIVQDPTLLDEGLEDGRTYFYVITAVNSRGIESVASVEASGTTLTRPAALDLTPILIAIVVLILAAALLVLLLFRRRKKRDRQDDKRET